MQTGLVIFAGWIVLSCTLGPVLAWAFFRSERRAKVVDAALDSQIASNPMTVRLAPDLLADSSHIRAA